MKRKLSIFLLLILAMVLVVGCQGMTPKQNVSAMMSTYNKVYDDYQFRVKDPGLTEIQKDNLRNVKTLLTEVYPKIKLYDKYVETGELPYPGIEAEINNLIFRLEKLLLKQIE